MVDMNLTTLLRRQKGHGTLWGLLNPLVKYSRRTLPPNRVRWGNLRRTEPFCARFGWRRGTPVDRYYIDDFLRRNSHVIRGDVLEIEDSTYTRRFGASRVTNAHVLDIDAANAQATVVGDLCAPDTLQRDAFDTIICTQTLQFLPDLEVALRNLWYGCRPGGDLLLTVPTMQPCVEPGDLWRWTPDGFRKLLTRHIPGARITLESQGNLLACVAFLMGISHEELRIDELRVNDATFPVICCASVHKEEAGSGARTTPRY
jgi:SAM-dependent methyltransferase